MKELRFKRIYFEQIASGRKPLEARINYPSLRSIRVGEVVRFFWEHRHVDVKITAIRTYASVSAMLDFEIPHKLISGMGKEAAIAAYSAIYPPEKVRQEGGMRVFAFELM
ncbi:MAG: hypothetical protein UT32_C0013G0022 [Parcubacteria group bacterium GW2011_GWC2_39_14]|nr:MAG: hypothetical protein UT32_C0013G0022 [Parcubacteria group bacterium GW2011_GWC2_39_14]KKR54510.1 MAG: hypothetical protein UT91_C0014G0022 [Parcubacteria group bacterium GW2011_GWA2_40_23]